MKVGWLLVKKELLESVRNFKWVWVPLVFLLLGIMDPITTFYMPEILKAGGVSSEVAKLIELPSSAEIMAKSLSQFGTLGLLVLSLSFMGTVAAERQSGSAIMVLSKPVTHTQYVLAKWTGMSIMTLASFGLGLLGSWYYTYLLFEPVAFRSVLMSFGVFALWLLFVNTMTLLFSCLLKSQAGVAFGSLSIAALLTVVAGLLDRFMQWSPSQLTKQAGEIVLNGQAGGSGLWVAIGTTAALIVTLLCMAVSASKRMWVRA